MERRELHLVAAKDLSSDAAEALVRRYEGLARSIAVRFCRGGQELDDLTQVAMFGLLQAIRRFDPDRGFEFSTFAHITIEGELKRYRRRTGWTWHVPRRLQEGYLRMVAALEELSTELHRQPSVAELAAHLEMTEDEVIELLELRESQRAASLDTGRSPVDGEAAIELRSEEHGYAAADAASFVSDLLARLNTRDREIVRLRFFDNLSQREIAERIGMSQMHVSRLLRLSLEKLRVLASG